jgi:sugar O-acyltransferase (sialic acid O-acetyltransferase NeuD family)
MNIKKKGICFGSGGIAQILFDEYSNSVYKDEFDICYFYVDEAYKKEDNFNGIPIITSLDDIENIEEYYFSIGVFDIRLRKKFIRLAESKNIKPTTLINPSAKIGRNVKIGKGSMIHVNSVIEGGTTIGEYCIIGSLTRIGHNTTIGNHCQISSLTSIGGYNTIGDNVLINTGCITIENLNVTSGAILGMGAVVFKDVPKGSIMIGNPARNVRTKKAIVDE